MTGRNAHCEHSVPGGERMFGSVADGVGLVVELWGWPAVAMG